VTARWFDCVYCNILTRPLPLSVCVYMCVYVCVCMCVRVYVCVCARACVCVHVRSSLQDVSVSSLFSLSLSSSLPRSLSHPPTPPTHTSHLGALSPTPHYTTPHPSTCPHICAGAGAENPPNQPLFLMRANKTSRPLPFLLS